MWFDVYLQYPLNAIVHGPAILDFKYMEATFSVW